MKNKLVILILLFVSISSVACNDQSPRAAGLSDSSCVALIKEIRTLEQKITWSQCEGAASEKPPAPQPVNQSSADPPPAAEVALDPAHCRLVNPNVEGLDKCLVDAIAIDFEFVSNPICPREVELLAVGDLAFFVLSDRYPHLWRQVIPPHVADGGLLSNTEWASKPMNRAALVESVEQALRK